MAENNAPVAASAPSAKAIATENATEARAKGGSPVADPKAAEQVKDAIRKLKLKIDGKEEELDEPEVIRLAQLGKASNKRFEEAKQMRQQAEQFMEMLRKDPKAVLSNPALGVDLRKFAEEVVWEHIQESSLTPEQKKARDVERELQKYKAQEEEHKKAETERQMQALHQKYASDYDRKITSALQASGLPKTPATVKRMAEYMFTAVQNGYDLEPSDLVEQVRKDYQDDIQQLFGQTSEDMLLSLLGEGTAKKLRNADMKRLKSPTGKVMEKRTTEQSSKPGAKPKRKSGGDWRADVMAGYLGK